MTNAEKLAHWIRHDPDEKQMKAFHELGIGTSMGTKSIYYTCSNCNSWVSLTYNYCPNCGCRKESTMTNKKRKQTGLLHSTDELKQLIAENPEMNGWINANYEQPNTARDVLVFEKGIGVSIGFFIDGWHMYGSNDFEIEVTYWRELPDPLGRMQYGKI